MPMVFLNRNAKMSLSRGKGADKLVMMPGPNDLEDGALESVENQDYLQALFEEKDPGLGKRPALEMMAPMPKGKKGKKGKPDPED